MPGSRLLGDDRDPCRIAAEMIAQAIELLSRLLRGLDVHRFQEATECAGELGWGDVVFGHTGILAKVRIHSLSLARRKRLGNEADG